MPVPKPTPGPTTTPAPKPTPGPTPINAPSTCIYNPKDALALEARKVIFGAPAECQQMINIAFSNFWPSDDIIDGGDTVSVLAMTSCMNYINGVMSTYYSSYAPTSICMVELVSYIKEYQKIFAGGVLNTLPDTSCIPYLTSFINDFLAHPTDSVHLAGCNATLSAALLPH